jgi:hypothetical protein
MFFFVECTVDFLAERDCSLLCRSVFQWARGLTQATLYHPFMYEKLRGALGAYSFDKCVNSLILHENIRELTAGNGDTQATLGVYNDIQPTKSRRVILTLIYIQEFSWEHTKTTSVQAACDNNSPYFTPNACQILAETRCHKLRAHQFG